MLYYYDFHSRSACLCVVKVVTQTLVRNGHPLLKQRNAVAIPPPPLDQRKLSREEKGPALLLLLLLWDQELATRVFSIPVQLSGKEKEDKWHDVTDDDEPNLPPFQPKRPSGPQLIQTTIYSPLKPVLVFFSVHL